jgi:Protein of unknown function (DUF3352)
VHTIVCARRFAAACATLGALAVTTGLAGCDSSAPSGTGADPATLAPASSVLYVGAVVRPEGALKQDAVADAKMLSDAKEPFAPLLQALAGSSPLGKVDYEKEVEPWLGRSAGLFATSPAALSSTVAAIEQSLGSGFSPEALLRAGASGVLGKGSSGAALVLDTSDLEKAKAFVTKLAKQDGTHQSRYRGVELEADSEGHAAAIVGKFAVFGDEAGVKATINAYLGGPSLQKAAPYSTLADKQPGDALAGVYLDPSAAAQSAAGGGTAGAPNSGGASGQTAASRAAAAQAEALLKALPGEPNQARLWIVPQHSAVTVDADLLGSSSSEAKAAASTTAAAELVGNLPNGAWIALGSGESGARLASYLPLLSGIVSLSSKSLLANFGGPALQQLFGRLAAHPRALQSLFSPWAGPAAVFAAGSGLLSLEAGVEIRSNSPTAARAAVARLGAMLARAGASVSPASVSGAESALSVRVPGLPVTLYVGAGNSRFVIGLGPESVQGALSPSSPLSSSSAYSSATSALGGLKPTVLVDFPMALSLLEGIGLSEDPTTAPALAELHSLGTLTGGFQPLGDGVTRLHLVLGLASSSGSAESGEG